MLLHCNACGLDKDSDDFNATNQRHAQNGKHAWCKTCVKTYNQRYHAQHAAESNAAAKNRRAAMTDQERLAHNRKAVEHNHKNPGKRRARQNRYYANHKGICIQRTRTWQTVTNPGAFRHICVLSEARKRARAKDDPCNDLSVEQWREILQAFGFRCAYCGKKSKKLEMEHIIPRSKGGSNTAANVVPACRSCNAKKFVGPAPIPIQPLLFTLSLPRKEKA